MSLVEERIEQQRLKLLSSQGVCPASERKEEKQIRKQQKIDVFNHSQILILKVVIDLYLNEVIENRVIFDQKTGVKK